MSLDKVEKKPATIKTIADRLNLSPATVSRALRNDKLVRPETIKRVQETAKQLNYRRDFRGVNLRTGKTFTLCAFLVTNSDLAFGDPATMHLIQGLIDGMDGSDFEMVIRPIAKAEEQMQIVQKAVEDGRFDGVVLDHTEPSDRRVRYLIENNVPFVTFGRTELFSDHAYFDIDNEDAAYVATKHLIEAGHKRVTLINPPPHYLFSKQRVQGYKSALKEAGITYDPALVVQGNVSPSGVEGAVKPLLQLDNPPSGFVTSNEVATLAVVKTCRLAGLRLDDIGIVSRDGTKFVEYYDQRVSSCYYPLLQAGKVLSEMLIARVNGEPISTLQRIDKIDFIAEKPMQPLA